MAEPGIVVDGVWKRFHRGEIHDSLRDLVPAFAKRLAGRGPTKDALGEGDFWALRDVSFEVKPGEALGIVGPNGAGKSTMLKVLTRILPPTRGSVSVRGRVGALIEVAAGFHPDLTGRENVYLQGSIMGMRRREITERLESIVEFAGVSEAIDTPVKRYSSGMNARLGFSIAAHLDPDLLVIDEVLSVGDMAFQTKCVERMKAFREAGVAIVFVSHNLQAVTELCSKALYLASSVQMHGPVLDTISAFVRSMTTAQSSGKDDVRIDGVRLLSEEGQPVDRVAPGTPLRLEARYTVRDAIAAPTFVLTVHRSTDGLLVYDGNFALEDFGGATLGAGKVLELVFSFRAHLTRGQYHFSLNVFDGSISKHVGGLSPAAFLQVSETRTWGGIADLDVRVAERR